MSKALERTHEKGGGPLNENGLTLKQQLFVDHYIVTLNGTESARLAGYTGNDEVLASMAWENLRKPQIISLLSKRLKRVIEKVEKQVIDVHDEFTEQLEFAKALRLAAREYLSDVNDPLRLSITPKAHEIEVTYFDHNDMVMGADNEMYPKKKKAQLNVLLEQLMTDGGFEADKFSVKTIDIRKFALDAIATTDMVIDKFARMSGSYQKNKTNEADVSELIDGLVDRLIEKGWERAKAREFAEQRYGGGQPLQLKS